MKKYCVYRFIDKSGTVIYIGSTEDFNKRMKNHNHLPKECYERTESVEATFFESESNMFIYEVFLINKYLPEYNSNMKGSGTNIRLYEPRWNNYGNLFTGQRQTSNKKGKRSKGYVLYFPNGSGVFLKEKCDVFNRLKDAFSKSDIYKMLKGEKLSGYWIRRIK